MPRYYSDFIELTPGFESVVDVNTDKNDYWTRYIINDDLVHAIKVLSKSLKRASNDDIWHFWLKGAYGTGKTYSALVIKHLLEDDVSSLEKFLNHPLLLDIKDKFIGIRKSGKYVIAWHSGECSRLTTTDRLLLELEKTIRESLNREGFHYMGRLSLIDQIKKVIKDGFYDWNAIYNDDAFAAEFGIYGSVDDFKASIEAGDLDACDIAATVLTKKGVLLANDLNTFKNWLKDVFQGNEGLENTGIFIIWDEFTDYIRGGNDIEILQELSQFSKEVPFYILYVIHEYPGMESSFDEKYMAKVGDRFHKIDISLSQTTTYKLIGESIMPRAGMQSDWNEICDDLLDTIKDKSIDFMPSEFDATIVDLKKLFPVHPKTVELISKVSENFAAAQRTVFRFLKDKNAEEESTGFMHFIRNNGPDSWKWATPDLLWDYFFIRNTKDSESKNFSKDADACMKNFIKHVDKISDEKALRIFKVAMLLLSIVGASRSIRKSFISGKKGLRATQNTIIDCLYGQLEKNTIEKYLRIFNDDLKILVVTKDKDDSRIELPFIGGGDEFDNELAKIKKEKTPYNLFDSVNGVFGIGLKKMFLPSDRAVVKRMEIETCWFSKISIDIRLQKLKEQITRFPYKFGVLLVSVPSNEELFKIQPQLENIAKEDETGRLIICVMRTPLDEDKLNAWYENTTHSVMAQKSSNIGSAKAYEDDANLIVGEWIQSAIGKEMSVYYRDSYSPSVNGNNGFVSAAEKIIFSVFPFAPETVIKTATLYMSGGPAAAAAGVSRDIDGQNQRIKNIIEILQNIGVWEIKNPEDFVCDGVNRAARSVANLNNYIHRKLVENAIVYLDELWREIQEKFGYYDTLVCYYLLGFVMSFYKDKDYSWFDGTEAHILNAATIPTMINAMCKDKVSGNKISIGSEQERRFREITKQVFALSENETINADQTRKNLRIKINRSTFPLWILKYLDGDKYLGIRNEITEIIQKYQDFILEIGDQSIIMENIFELFKNKAKTYITVLSDIYKDKAVLSQGVKTYIFGVQKELSKACEKYGFSIENLFDMLKENLQEEVWQWKEQDVSERLNLLLQDAKLVGIVNGALGGNARTVEKTKDTLENKFRYMKIPGIIFETINEPWSKAVKNLYLISQNKWVSYDLTKKSTIIFDLEKNISEAWRNITDSKEVLGKYLLKLEKKHTDNELIVILSKLNEESYLQSENSFKTNLINIQKELEYTKKVTKLKEIWTKYSNTKDIYEWCNINGLPLFWLIPKKEELITTLKQCKNNERIDFIRLDNAISELEKNGIDIINDHDAINRCFIEYVSSENYVSLLLDRVEDIRAYLKSNVSRDVVTWANDVSSIRKEVTKYILSNLHSEVVEKAKKRLLEMNDKEIRNKIAKLLDVSPEICLMLLAD